MQSIIIGSNQAGQRFDKFLHKYLPQATTGFLYKMLRKKNITLNGKKAEGSEMLCEGDEVRFFFAEETFAKFAGKEQAVLCPSAPGQPLNKRNAADSYAFKYAAYEKAYKYLRGIQVLYEDDHILIVNKPAGILTQKASPQDVSLNEWVIGYLLAARPALKEELDTFRPSVCNRLDRNTSGIVLCGKSLAGLQYLSRCIRERSVRKFYRTICVGRLEKEAVIRGYLVKDSARNRVTVSSVQGLSQAADYIETGYRPLCATDHYTLLEVELITGKTHQIRAHLAGTGHPLAGDFKYGDARMNRQLRDRFGLQHQLLHACRIVFPVTEEPAGLALSGKTINASCPVLFARIQNELHLEEGKPGNLGA